LGIVVKQASISAVLSYLGVLLGFLNVAIFMNRWLTPDELGLRNVLLDIAVVYSQFANLGVFKGMVKFFPFFQSGKKLDRGLLSISLLTSFVGFIFIALLILLFKSDLLNSYDSDSKLFADYFWVIFPLSFALLINGILESYLQARSNTVVAALVKNVIHRVLITIIIVAYFFKVVDFEGFVFAFVVSYFLNIVIYLIYLGKKGFLHLTLDLKFFNKRLRKVFYNYSLYSILSNFSSILVTKVDVLMVWYYVGLTAAAIYTNSLFLTVLMMVPAIAIANITLPLLSHSWKLKNLAEIDVLYKKTAINQFLIGGAIFVLIWASIDNFFELQRDIYSDGKWVFFLLGLSRVFNLLFGVNNQIINITKYFRFDSYSSFVLVVFTIISNWFMIRWMGMEGAALATTISLVLFNMVRSYYLYNKLGIQPFTFKTIQLSIVLIVSFCIGHFLPHLSNIYADTVYRSAVVSICLGVPIYYFKISEDINQLVDNSLKKIGLLK
tara:strand:+ start:41 stop:1525 length:1485 start_codon:yes stop_codon:yes gene_type:complete